MRTQWARFQSPADRRKRTRRASWIAGQRGAASQPQMAPICRKQPPMIGRIWWPVCPVKQRWPECLLNARRRAVEQALSGVRLSSRAGLRSATAAIVAATAAAVAAGASGIVCVAQPAAAEKRPPAPGAPLPQRGAGAVTAHYCFLDQRRPRCRVAARTDPGIPDSAASEQGSRRSWVLLLVPSSDAISDPVGERLSREPGAAPCLARI